MTIDINKLREKHQKLSQTNSTNFENFLQIKDEPVTVRILPWKDDTREFYAETKIHRIEKDVNDIKNYHCPKHAYNESCPICGVYFDIWEILKAKKIQKEESPLRRLAGNIKPRLRYYMNVWDYESKSVKILSMGDKFFKALIGKILDEDYGVGIVSFGEGIDYKIIKTMTSQGANSWATYDQSCPRPKSSNIGVKKESLIEQLHDVHSLIRKEEAEELEKVAEWLRDLPEFTDPMKTVAEYEKELDNNVEEESEEEDENAYIKKLKG